MSEAIDTNQVPWGELTEAFWRDAGEQVKASEQQVMLAACLFAGWTQTAAARLAGYSSENDRARKSGSEAARTTRVRTLIALATAEVKARNLPAAPRTLMTKEESLERLTDIARGGDKSLALRAIEALNKNEAQPTDIGAFALLDDGFNDWRLVRDYLRIAGGAAAIASIYDGQAGELESMPLLLDVVEMLKRDNPGFYDWLRSRQSRVGLALLDQRLANPQWQMATRKKIWREIGMTIEDVEAQASPCAEAKQAQAAARPVNVHSSNGSATAGALEIGR